MNCLLLLKRIHHVFVWLAAEGLVLVRRHRHVVGDESP